MSDPPMSSLVPLRLQFQKNRDGSCGFAMLRSDGTNTRQRHKSSFFAFHDLAHYAVETILGHRRGFYGLVAEGWNLEDFGSPWPRGKMPADMDPSELIVGFFDLERATGTLHTADELNESAQSYSRAHGAPPPDWTLSTEQVGAIRTRIGELHARWRALPLGETLTLEFPAPSHSD
jgi:hypothetical protein